MTVLFLFSVLAQIIFQASSKTNSDLINPIPLSQGVQIAGGAASDNLGTSVNYAGDVNHDGIDDIIIGAPTASPLNRAGAGTVYVIYGKKTAMTADISLTGTLPLSEGFQIFGGGVGDNLGQSVSFAGDFNNDGIDDILIGANKASPLGRSGAGQVYVIYGKAGGITTNIDLGSPPSISLGFMILGSLAGDYLGSSVNYAGDVNKDGVDDIIVGANGANPSGINNAGAVYVIYGVTNGMTSTIDLATALTSSQGFKISGGIAFSQLGISVSRAGDVNKDGISDVIVGAYATTTSQFTAAGIITVIYGKTTAQAVNIDLSTSLPLSQGFQIFGGAANDYLGRAVSTAGDFNADGIDDILVSSFKASPFGRSEAGSVYIIYGVANGMTSHIYLSNPLPLSQGFRIDGGAGNWHLGCSSNYAGDVNKDGVADVIIGSDLYSLAGRLYAGAAFVVYGKANGMAANIDLSTPLLLSQGFQVIGGAASDHLGISLSTAGDFNHDGISDILIGAKAASPSGLNRAGAAYVLYDPPYCSVVNCISCSGSKCVDCATDYLLYIGDGKCYTPDTCPSGTTPNATNCVDTFMQSLGAVQSVATQGASMAASAVSLVSFNNPSGLIFNALAGILQYMQYMSIAYPPKLQYLLDQPNPSLLFVQYISAVPKELEDDLPSFELPDNFEKNGIHSCFLANFWSSLVSLAIICTVISFACLAYYLTHKCKFINSKFKKLKEALKWNYLLASFTGYFGDIAFYSSFEFRTTQMASFLEILSFNICVLMNLLLIVISVKIFTVNKAISQEKNSRNLEKLKKQFSSYQVVFDNFKTTSLIQQSYFLISCIRFYFFYSILAYLFDYPLIQAIFINAQSLAFLCYLIIKRPLSNPMDLIASIVLELILEVIHACMFWFAVISQNDPNLTVKAVTLGNVIIWCTFAFMGAQCIYMIIQIVLLLINLIKFIVKIIIQKQERQATKIKKNVLKLRDRNHKIDQPIIDNMNDNARSGLPERKDIITPLQRATMLRRRRELPQTYIENQHHSFRSTTDPRVKKNLQ